MSIQDIGSIGELLAALATLGTLIYLAAQIRQNSKMMRANTKQAISDSTQSLLYTMNEDPETFRKLLSGEEMDEIEKMRVWIFMRATLRGFETQLFHYRSGLLDEQEWTTLKHTILNTMLYPESQDVWQELQGVVSPELRSLIEDGYTNEKTGDS